MTEVVTSSAAFQQLNLLAPRQQAFVVERQGVDAGFATADIAPTALDTSSDTFSHSKGSSSDENPVNHHQEQAAPQPEISVSGPSKARVEIKHIDLGLTPSEVVGTPDILQRFDTNGDHRVDLIEAARAGLAREGVFTFAGLSVGPQLPEPVAPTPAPEPAAVGTSAALVAESVDQKLFTPTDLPGAAPTKKLYAAAQAAAVHVAAEGAPTGSADAPKKFYGQGAEVVVGKFAVADTAPRFVDKSAEKTPVVTEDATGEATAHDKVAQADTDQAQGKAGGDTADNPTFEKARQIAAAHAKKLVLVEVAAYADASAITQAAESQATAVTA